MSPYLMMLLGISLKGFADLFFILPLSSFLEWACIKAINPHLDWPKEQTVGIHIDVSHEAATTLGLEVTATVELVGVEGKNSFFLLRLTWRGLSQGCHERFVM